MNLNLFSVLTAITIISLVNIINGQLTVYDYTATNKLTTTLTCSDPNGCIVNCFGGYACDDAAIVASAADVLIVNCYGGIWACINLAIAAGPKVNATITCAGRAACGVCSSCTNPYFLLTNTPYVKLICDASTGQTTTTSAGAPCSGRLTASNADIVEIEMLGDYSSYYMTIDVDTVTTLTSITATGYKSLYQSTINAVDSNRLEIDCQAEGSCWQNTVYPPYLSGEYTTSINCGWYDNSCFFMKVEVADSTKLPNNYLELKCPPIPSFDNTCDIRHTCTNGASNFIFWDSDLSLYTCNNLGGVCCPWSSADDMVAPPTNAPTEVTMNPTSDPTIDPTIDPSIDPTSDPTVDPSADPTSDPTVDPTSDPTTGIPSQSPTTAQPTDQTSDPTTDPTMDPTADPTADPTSDPTADPTADPTSDPTADPSTDPAASTSPTTIPTKSPNGDTPDCSDTPFECSDGTLVSQYYSEEDGECVWPACANDNSSKACVIDLFVPMTILFVTFIFIQTS